MPARHWDIWGAAEMTAKAATVPFSRSLGPIGVAFLTLSALSPVASVYVFGSGVIHIGGTGAIAGLIVGGLVMAALGLLYGELGAAFPNAGGVFPAFASLLGPVASFPYVAMMTCIAPALVAFLSLGIGENIHAMVPELSQAPAAIGCLWAATAIAVLNVRTGAIVTSVFLAVELMALAVITTVAAWHPVRGFLPTLVHPVIVADGALAPLPLPLLGLAIIAGTFTCSGASFALYFAQELPDAERRIGRVAAWTSALAPLSIGVPLILALLATPELVAMLASDAPAAKFLDQTASPAIATFVNFSVLIAMFNAAVAMLMGLARFLYATGRDGIWPEPIGRLIGGLHPKSHSPLNATVALATCATMMIALGERVLLVLVSNQLTVEFVLLAAAVLIGRRRGLTGTRYRAPLHPLLPILAILLAGAMIAADWLDAESGRPSLLVLATILMLSYGYARLRLNPDKRGEASIPR